MFFRRRRKNRVIIEWERDEQTGKLYMWDMETGRLLTMEEVDKLLDRLQQYMKTVDEQEIQEINRQIRFEEIKEQYRNYIESNASYTNHVLSKEYRGDLPGYVVCYEDHEGYIHFDCTKKTKDQTLDQLLNRLSGKIKTIHHVYEATEVKKLCAWLDHVFAPGIRRNVFIEGEEIIPLKSYDSDFKEYLIQSLKEQRDFPKGIKDLIVEGDS